MRTALEPSLSELSDAVRSGPRWMVAGAGTKLRFGDDTDVPVLSTRKLRGIVEYAPEEFVITALAGTPVRELADELGKHGQYLPFDPLLADAGATLGGVVATGTNGPGRFRYGGVRDFILGVRYADGGGQLLRAGSKVVKNAAGFDLPKFFVGSRGGFGLLAEVTLKVFPRPKSELTLALPVSSPEEAAGIMITVGRSRWQPHALDLPPAGDAVLVRLGGPEEALDAMARDVLTRWPGRVLDAETATKTWTDLRELGWAHSGGLWYKLALPGTRWPEVRKRVQDVMNGRIHITVGGDAAYASWPAGTDPAAIGAALRIPGVAAMRLDRIDPTWPDEAKPALITRAMKEAMDPEQRYFFPQATP